MVSSKSGKSGSKSSTAPLLPPPPPVPAALPTYCCSVGSALVLFTILVATAGVCVVRLPARAYVASALLIFYVLPGNKAPLLKLTFDDKKSILVTMRGLCSTEAGGGCSEHGTGLNYDGSALDWASTADQLTWDLPAKAFVLHLIVACGAGLTVFFVVAGFLCEDMDVGRLCFNPAKGRNMNAPGYWLGAATWAASLPLAVSDIAYIRSGMQLSHKLSHVTDAAPGSTFIVLAGGAIIALWVGFGIGTIHWFCRRQELDEDEFVFKDSSDAAGPQDGVWTLPEHMQIRADGKWA